MYDREKTVRFVDIEDIMEFVDAASACDFDIDIKCNRNYVDAKSLLGMMAVGLSNNVKVCYGGDNKKFQSVVEKFAIA